MIDTTDLDTTTTATGIRGITRGWAQDAIYLDPEGDFAIPSPHRPGAILKGADQYETDYPVID